MENEETYNEYTEVKKPFLYFEERDLIFISSEYFPLTGLLSSYTVKGNKILVGLTYLIILALSIVTLCLDLIWLVVKPFSLYLIETIKDTLNYIRIKTIDILYIVIKWFLIVIMVIAALFIGSLTIYALFDSGQWRVLKDWIVNLF